MPEGYAFCSACGARVAVSNPAPTAPVTPNVPPVDGTGYVEPAKTPSHLKMNLSSDPAPVEARPTYPSHAPAASAFFTEAGNLGPGNDSPRPAAAPSPAAVPYPASSPASGAVPYHAAPPAAPPRPAVPYAGESAVPTAGGFVESESSPPIAKPAVNYAVNPYDRYLEKEPYEEKPKPKRKRKRWPIVLVIVLVMLLAAAAAAWFLIPDVQNMILGEPSISFEKDKIELEVGDGKTNLNKLLELERVSKDKIHWECDDDDQSVITMRDGKVTPVGAGSCEVKVYSVSDDDVYDTIKVIVTDPRVEKAAGTDSK